MGRPRTFDVDQVLDAAVVTFWERGYTGTSLADLLDATGLSRSSLYAAFGDKEGLFLAVLDRYLERVVDFVLGPLEAEGADLDTLMRTFTGLGSSAKDAPMAFGCLIAHSGSERARLDEAVHKRVVAHQERMEAAYANVLRGAQRAGQLGPEASVDELAAMLTVFTRGLVTQIRAGADPVSLAASTRAIVALLRQDRT
ncbi:MAG: TetR/AcrR family transcriptional regulator [Myxococcota bacterium]